MIKSLTNVGNSKAIILPKSLIDKYHLDKVTIHEVDQGILIKPASGKLSFQEKVAQLKKRKQEIYASMKAQAEDPEVIAYYENEALPDVDVDIIEL